MWPNNPALPPAEPPTTKAVERFGRLTPAGWVTAVIYKTPEEDYYFSCETCGNSGQHWHGKDYAIVQGLDHVLYFDHTPYLEEHHE